VDSKVKWRDMTPVSWSLISTEKSVCTKICDVIIWDKKKEHSYNENVPSVLLLKPTNIFYWEATPKSEDVNQPCLFGRYDLTALHIIAYFYTILVIKPTTTLYWGAPKTFKHPWADITANMASWPCMPDLLCKPFCLHIQSHLVLERLATAQSLTW